MQAVNFDLATAKEHNLLHNNNKLEQIFELKYHFCITIVKANEKKISFNIRTEVKMREFFILLHNYAKSYDRNVRFLFRKLQFLFK